MPNCYQILGIDENAGSADIKAAFKRQALKYHPDKHGGDRAMEELFKEVNRAYQVLSNPYTKHKYDMSLRHGAFDVPPPPRPWYRRPYSPFDGPPVYERPSVMSKANLMATLYAFLFAFGIGILVTLGTYIHQSYTAYEREQLLTQRRSLYAAAQSKFEAGQLRESLSIIDDMGMFLEPEQDIKAYKDMLLKNIAARGEQSMREQHYRAALQYYDIISGFFEGKTLNALLHQAEAYRQLGDFHRALSIYRQLFYNGYNGISYYLQVGDIYENGLHNYEIALKQYQIATDKAKQAYTSTFGKAYPAVINAKFIPANHFEVFTRLANAYYLTGDYQMAVKSTEWPKIMWPDSAAHYKISAKSWQALNNTTAACADFSIAERLDKNFTAPIECR